MATRPKAAKAPVAVAAPEVVAPEAVAPEVVVSEAVETEVVAAAPKAPEAPAAVKVESVTVTITNPMEKAVKTAEEFVAFGQGNVEAFVKSGQIWAAGVQDLSKQAAATAQAQFDEAVSVFKALSTVKSLKDAFELQTTFAKATVEKTLAESGKMTDASMKLTEQAFAPIAARVTFAVETFTKAA